MDPLAATPLDAVEPVPEPEAADELVAEPVVEPVELLDAPPAEDAPSPVDAPPAEDAPPGEAAPPPVEPVEPAVEPVEADVAPPADDPLPADETLAAQDAPPAGVAPPAEPAESGAEPADDAAPPVAPAPSTVAELIAATLRAAGVRLAFTVPGESFLPLLDALTAAGIRVVATHHEGAAAFAAEAYGQLTGRPAACLGTRIVGAANLAIGIHTATADSTPMFAIAGDVRRSFEGREAFQQVDLVETVGRLAKWAGRIDDPAEAEAQLEAAARAVAEGRPGPAFIAVPEDVLPMPLPDGTRVPTVRPHPPAPEAAEVRAVLQALASAERPVSVAGAGVLRARSSNDLVRLAELLHVPIVSSWRRGDVVPNDHALYLGMTGFGSPRVVRRRIEAADLVVVIGCRLNEPTTSGYRWPRAGQAWIHVDLEPVTEAVRDTPAPMLAVRSDARAFVRAAVARLKDAVLLAAPLAIRDLGNTSDRAAWEAATVVDAGEWTGPGVHPGRIVADLRRLLPEDAILTTDAGSFAGWAARGFRFRRPGTFLGPTSGAMGYGFPAAIAAGRVHRERRVVALVGDGGMGMVLAELETAVREAVQVVAVVFDNQQYGMIHDHQVREGSPTTPGTDLGPIDFAAAARACGARGVRVETDAAFEPALRNALAASGPTVIQVALDRRWVSVDDNPVSGS